MNVTIVITIILKRTWVDGMIWAWKDRWHLPRATRQGRGPRSRSQNSSNRPEGRREYWSSFLQFRHRKIQTDLEKWEFREALKRFENCGQGEDSNSFKSWEFQTVWAACQEHHQRSRSKRFFWSFSFSNKYNEGGIKMIVTLWLARYVCCRTLKKIESFEKFTRKWKEYEE